MRRGRELCAAIGLLTRMPLGRYLPAPDTVDYAASVWAYPLVGGMVGLVAAVVYRLAVGSGMAPLLGSVWALVAAGLITGALHEDGLADCADGLAGGRTPARRLEIMRDSRIGSYGALALILLVGVRVAAIAAIGRPWLVGAALVVSGALGRMAMVLVMWRGEAARRDGLAAGLGVVPGRSVVAAMGVTVVIAVALLGVARAMLVVAMMLGLAVVWGVVIRRAVGGYTGDTLGAIEVMIEAVVLSVLCAMMPGLAGCLVTG